MHYIVEFLSEKTTEVFNGGYATLQIDVSIFAKGVSFITLQKEKEIVSRKFV